MKIKRKMKIKMKMKKLKHRRLQASLCSQSSWENQTLKRGLGLSDTRNTQPFNHVPPSSPYSYNRSYASAHSGPLAPLKHAMHNLTSRPYHAVALFLGHYISQDRRYVTLLRGYVNCPGELGVVTYGK